MGKDRVRIGIIGAGRIGKIHADNLLRNPHAEIVGISDLFAGPELEAWASVRGISVVTTDSSQLISMPNVDAVLICSSTDTHVPLIEQAAQAGIFSARNRSVWIWLKPKRLWQLCKRLA